MLSVHVLYILSCRIVRERVEEMYYIKIKTKKTKIMLAGKENTDNDVVIHSGKSNELTYTKIENTDGQKEKHGG